MMDPPANGEITSGAAAINGGGGAVPNPAEDDRSSRNQTHQEVHGI